AKSLDTVSGSGDTTLQGDFDKTKVKVSSGSVEINSESVPKYSDIDISSGSVDYIIPDSITGFKLSYEKSSGGIDSEFDLNNSLDNDKGTATYKKGSNKINAKLSSGSLDLVKYK
ncbi:MAG: DUF4097 family beta strand repeat-containing protein, partial [Ruminococcus sp.]